MFCTNASLAGFAALSKACSFAEEIIAKYGKLNEEYQPPEAFVFLKGFRETLQKEKKSQDETLIALRLMISRQLILLGKAPALNAERSYSEALEYRISSIMTRLKSTDRIRWRQLLSAQRVIENEKAFLSLIRTNSIYDAAQARGRNLPHYVGAAHKGR